MCGQQHIRVFRSRSANGMCLCVLVVVGVVAQMVVSLAIMSNMYGIFYIADVMPNHTRAHTHSCTGTQSGVPSHVPEFVQQ